MRIYLFMCVYMRTCDLMTNVRCRYHTLYTVEELALILFLQTLVTQTMAHTMIVLQMSICQTLLTSYTQQKQCSWQCIYIYTHSKYDEGCLLIYI